MSGRWAVRAEQEPAETGAGTASLTHSLAPTAGGQALLPTLPFGPFSPDPYQLRQRPLQKGHDSAVRVQAPLRGLFPSSQTLESLRFSSGLRS